MGGTTWTTERNERLFVLLLRIAKVDGNAFASLATAYKAEFTATGIDNYEPTAKAIKEHVDKLKKSVGGKGAANGGTPKTTPRKPAAIKTPTSTVARKSINKTPSRGTKRKRTKSSSDEMSEGEEDSNDERKMLKSAASVARSSLSRRSKSTPKSYHQQSSEDEDADAEASADENTYAGATVNGAAGDSVAGAATTSEQMEVDGADVTTGDGQPTPQGKIANGKNAKSSKNRGIKHEIVDAESDVSDFLPMF